jgi:4-hydroxy-3-methylbut-2-enyl diphosphate reductase IspH
LVNIKTARCAGFCEGVANAYKKAIEAAEKNKNVFMLGSLVHNKQVVQDLQNRGIKIINDIDEISTGSGYILISAHGVAPYIYEKARKKGLKIIDTTCSWVKKAQKIA